MTDRELRRRCEQILRGLDIPDHSFTIDELCDLVAQRQGRPIHLIPEQLPTNSPCGLAVRTERFDAIFYEENTSRLHQELIISHELGHLLCGHQSVPVVDADASRLLLPHLDPSLVRAVLGRTNYRAVEEREAEMIASLVVRQLVRGPERTPTPVDPELAPVLNRLHHTLEDSGRRHRG